MDDPEDLRAFVEVVHSGGFSRAAGLLGVSKSMVSRRVSHLEDGLGTRLLDRNTRGVRPTAAGEELLVRAERILAEYEEAREAVSARGGRVIGTLRVTAPISLGVLHVVPVLGRLAAENPGLHVDVDFSDGVEDLIQGRYDAAIRAGTPRDSSLVIRRLASARGLLVGSRAYLDGAGWPREPRDLAQHECLIYGNAPSSDWRFMAGDDLVLVRPRGRIVTNNGEAQLQWAIDGLGLALLPDFIARKAVRDGVLEHLLPEYPTPEFPISVIRPPGAFVPAKVRVLIDALVEAFSACPDIGTEPV